MECGSEFLELVNHNEFVRDLDSQGYHIDFIGGYFVIFGIPYLDSSKQLKHGDWFSPVDLDGPRIDPPSNHQAWFRGQRPCNETGAEIKLGGGVHQLSIADGIVTDHSFSFKLKQADGQLRNYVSFEEKVNTYLDMIVSPAVSAFPDATPLRAIEIKAAKQNSPLQLPDTMSARYNINDISEKLRGKSVAIVGLGGTGSYILDFLAKTHLDRILLFDDDKVHIHTLFRFPGSMKNAIGRKKVDILTEYYCGIHSGIEPNDEQITADNLDRLKELNFVFVSIDDAESRGIIVKYLAESGVPFLDCGMGLTRSVTGLNGMVRISGIDEAAYRNIVGTPFLPTQKHAEDEYRKQAQIAEFNALNASLAVIRFKQHFELYDLIDSFDAIVFESCSFEIDRSGNTQ